MSETKGHEARWSLVFWLLPAAGLVGYSAWCVADGWFRPGYSSQLFSQAMAPVSLVVAFWCLWQGIKEYRKVKAEEEKEGTYRGTISCPFCGSQTKRGGFALWQYLMSIFFFPLGMLSLLAGRQPSLCKSCQKSFVA